MLSRYFARVLARALIALPFYFVMVPAHAGPQHWGFGQGYLAAIEKTPDGPRLTVYEAPLRAKNAQWFRRWVDTAPSTGVVPAGLAVGDFEPGEFGSASVMLLEKASGHHAVRWVQPPQVFGTMRWRTIGTGEVPFPVILGAAAADPLGEGRDRLLLLVPAARGAEVVVLDTSRPMLSDMSPRRVPVRVLRRAPLSLPGPVTGFAAGDFWGEKADHLAVAFAVKGKTLLRFYRLEGDSLRLVTTDRAKLPALAPGGLTAGDYVQDGFDALTLVPRDPKAPIEVRAAPAKSAKDAPSPGPHYNGRALSRQWLPGAGRDESRITMTARIGPPDTGAAGQPLPGPRPDFVAIGAGQLFGYVRTKLDAAQREANGYDPAPDAEIAFVHRFPTPSTFAGAPDYGWPKKGETMGYEIALKNNGQTAIPAGRVKLRVWINTPYRNADVEETSRSKPSQVITVNEPLPPFDPANPQYVTVRVSTPWPYDLVPAGPGATWQKINLNAVGERWLVVSMDEPGGNPRNDRYEAALHAHTFHPILRSEKSLADRLPTVKGDAPSKEYLSRKLADAITCMWERSGTTDNGDVLMRVHFDGYDLGWPGDLPEPQRSQKWRAIQDKYEGWRELDGWWGENQTWERFRWEDGAAELHEAGHLFHPLGDLYQYAVSPVTTGVTPMADGTPVQIATYCWGMDSFSTNHALIGPPASEQMRRFVVGTRGGGIERWWELAPEKIFIRVLDRAGKPVPNAQVTLFPLGSPKPAATGTTGPDGRWDTGMPAGEPRIDKFGRKHYARLNDEMTFVVTAALPGYQDAWVLGQETLASHGRHTVMYHSFINEKEWTWDFRTNYRAGAPAPTFTVEAAVQGKEARLGVTGRPGATYRVYRRWEPSYNRVLAGEYKADGPFLAIPQDMAAPDSHRSGRFRATYEVTEVMKDGESLPRVVQVTGLTNTRGVSALPDGNLIVASNAGIANPWGILFFGTTPTREFLYHFRFGHTGQKIVPSKMHPGRFYATLAASDMNPDYRFDIIEPPAENRPGGYDVRNDLGSMQVESATGTNVTLARAADASRLLPGDTVSAGDRRATVLKVEGATLTLDAPLFPEGNDKAWLSATRTAGRPGARAELRELKDPRGLAVVEIDGKEFIAIADTGNARVVLWDDATGYVRSLESPDNTSPIAVASGLGADGFVVLHRGASGSFLTLHTPGGDSMLPLPALGVSIDPTEMGLAIATDPDSGEVFIAVSDASRALVEEYNIGVDGNALRLRATHARPTGTFAGQPALERPTDVAYSIKDGALQLFAVDGNHRIVRLR